MYCWWGVEVGSDMCNAGGEWRWAVTCVMLVGSGRWGVTGGSDRWEWLVGSDCVMLVGSDMRGVAGGE